MIVTGFMGSPRKAGNTAFLLNSFLKEAEIAGAETRQIHVPDLNIHPCTGCGICEKKGVCHFDDDMQQLVFPLLRKSDLVVIAAPIYFYNAPAELKALIDRSQALWARKFKLRLNDPCESSRKGFLLSVGATRGKDLFEGIHLTMKYFFRGISANFSGQLTYNRTEDPGEIKKHPTVESDIRKTVQTLIPLSEKTKPSLIFVCRSNSLTSQMAAAFAQKLAGDRLRILSAGTRPAETVHPDLVVLMAEKGIDVAFRKPQGIASAMSLCSSPSHVVILGQGEDTAIHVHGAKTITWNMVDPLCDSSQGSPLLRDQIEGKVKDLLAQVLPGNKSMS